MGQDAVKLTLNGRGSGVGTRRPECSDKADSQGGMHQGTGSEGWVTVKGNKKRRGRQGRMGDTMALADADKGKQDGEDKGEGGSRGYEDRKKKRKKAGGEKEEDAKHYTKQEEELGKKGQVRIQEAGETVKEKRLLRITWVKSNFDVFVGRLHEEAIMQDLADIKSTEERLGEEWIGERKNVNRRRDQVIPGKWNLYDTVENENGEEIHDPEEVVKQVGEYFDRQTQKKDLKTLEVERDELVQELLKDPDCVFDLGTEIEPTEEQFQDVAGWGRSSACGTDGMPYMPLRKCHKLAGTANYRVFKEMKTTRKARPFFREGRLCLPPKKSLVKRAGRVIAKITELRPLTVHIVSFRQIYLTIAIILKPEGPHLVHEDQWGAVGGCSSNVAWADISLAEAALKGSAAGLLLVDFAGAFTSVCHEWVRDVLIALQCPLWIRMMVEVAFVGIVHSYAFQGKSCKTMLTLEGITMGNPIAAHIFVFALEPGLRLLRSRFSPAEGLRGYMDDLA